MAGMWFLVVVCAAIAIGGTAALAWCDRKISQGCIEEDEECQG